MQFHVFQCADDPDYFIVTDDAHLDQVDAEICPRGGELDKVGTFAELGDERVAFNEAIAKSAIRDHGYYVFEARSFRPEGFPPNTMPG